MSIPESVFPLQAEAPAEAAEKMEDPPLSVSETLERLKAATEQKPKEQVERRGAFLGATALLCLCFLAAFEQLGLGFFFFFFWLFEPFGGFFSPLPNC